MIEAMTNSDSSLPMKHQISKLVLGTLAGFAAGKLTEKAYDAALACYKNRKMIVK
jgi:hypothetical protein